MPKVRAIRVIKKSAKTVEKAAQAAVDAPKSARAAVETVSNWVNELQQKKREEASKAFQLLFRTPLNEE